MLDILKHPLRMDYHVGIALILIILPGFIQTRDSSELDESQEEVTLDDLQTEKHSPSCTYRGRHYNPGDMFTPHPCTSCLCPESGGPVSCSYVQCQPQANCIAYDPDKNKCCPKCLEKGCVYKNRTFSAGARIPTDACTVCYCPWEGGQARCASHRCKPVECVNPLITDGNCCPTCPNGADCKLGRYTLRANKVYRFNKCLTCRCRKVAPDASAEERIAHCWKKENCQ